MKLYLSARNSRKEELKAYAEQLTALKHEVVSSWLIEPPIPEEDDETPAPSYDSGGLDPTHEGSDMSFQGNEPSNMQSTRELLMADRAAKIYTDILDCDGFIAFTDNQNHTREASYAEYGIALGRAGKKMWIVGKRYNEIHYYKNVKAFPTFPEFLKMLERVQTTERQQQEGHKGG